LPFPSSSIRRDVSNTTMTVGGTRFRKRSGSSCAEAVADHHSVAAMVRQTMPAARRACRIRESSPEWRFRRRE
jgi:hypothetical protein